MLLDQAYADYATAEPIAHPVGGPPCAAELRAVIAALFFERPGRLDIRHLWTTGRYSFFRVNRWSEQASRIAYSAFIRVEALAAGWRAVRP